MAVPAMTKVIDRSQAVGTDRLVPMAIARRAYPGGSGAHPSAATIARDARVGERTARRAIERLEDAGELRVHPNLGRCSAYTVVCCEEDDVPETPDTALSGVDRAAGSATPDTTMSGVHRSDRCMGADRALPAPRSSGALPRSSGAPTPDPAVADEQLEQLEQSLKQENVGAPAADGGAPPFSIEAGVAKIRETFDLGPDAEATITASLAEFAPDTPSEAVATCERLAEYRTGATDAWERTERYLQAIRCGKSRLEAWKAILPEAA
jgi:Helix-turn-helix domain